MRAQVRDLTLQVPAGTNLLVTGPNGAGKSSLFRVLGGLWPLAAGRIGKPGSCEAEGLCADIFYVPQRPYVTVGTLQEQLIYPRTLPGDGSDLISREEQRRLLRKVDLEVRRTRHQTPPPPPSPPPHTHSFVPATGMASGVERAVKGRARCRCPVRPRTL